MGQNDNIIFSCYKSSTLVSMTLSSYQGLGICEDYAGVSRVMVLGNCSISGNYFTTNM